MTTLDATDRRAEAVMEAIRTRRVVRDYTPEAVADGDLRKILEAARWASSGGNRRIHKLIVVRNPTTIRLIRMMSPGMRPLAPALIVICTDAEKAARAQVPLDTHKTRWVDVGTMAMNMMLAAHALGLGTCPITSFSRAGSAVMLELPPTLLPELILTLGHPAPAIPRRKPTRLTIEDFTYWERYGGTAP